MGKISIAFVGDDWGDEGKGKFVDTVAASLEAGDINARCTGGANSGHTVAEGTEELICHLVPSGIKHDQYGIINVITRGVAIDPRQLIEELDKLDTLNISYNHLQLSRDAHLVLPQHLVMDRIKESSAGQAKIGTTGRGIGPTFTDFPARIELAVVHMLNKDMFYKQLQRNLRDKTRILTQMIQEGAITPDTIREVMDHPHLMDGAFYDPDTIFNTDAIMDMYGNFGRNLQGRLEITDTEDFMRQHIHRVNVIFEGSQGRLLALDSSMPYVTSSDPTVMGIAKGAGLRERDIEKVIGIVKFYKTRVGCGPFPTELGGEFSDEWCNTQESETNQKILAYADTIPDERKRREFLEGYNIRIIGKEYGATTGRPRRIGHLDLLMLKAAVEANGPDIALSKVDVLSGVEEIKICTSYTYNGPDIDLGNVVLTSGTKMDRAILRTEILKHCTPNYEVLPGWQSDISGIKRYEDLPFQLQGIVGVIQDRANVNIRALSVGKEREQIVDRGLI